MDRDDEIVKRMVTEMAETSEPLISRNKKLSEDFNTFKKLVPVLLEKGVDNVNLSMFNEATRKKLLDALGEEYLRKGELNNAIKVFILSGNKERLTAIGEDYERLGDKCLEDGHILDAIKAFRILNDVPKLTKVGQDCVDKLKYDYAVEVFT